MRRDASAPAEYLGGGSGLRSVFNFMMLLAAALPLLDVFALRSAKLVADGR